MAADIRVEARAGKWFGWLWPQQLVERGIWQRWWILQCSWIGESILQWIQRRVASITLELMLSAPSYQQHPSDGRGGGEMR